MTRSAVRAGRGQSLVEFAIALPVFLFLVVAVFDLGRYVVAYSALTNAAREGARLAVVNQTPGDIDARVQEMAFLTAPTVLTPLFLVAAPAVNDADLTDNARCSPVVTGCVAVVRVTADLSPITPIVGSILGPITLDAMAMQPVEFVCPNPSIPGFASPDSCPKQAS